MHTAPASGSIQLRFAQILVAAALGLVAIALACTKTQVQSADTVAIDLTNAVCAPLEAQPAGQPWVDIVCTIAQGVEQGIGIAAMAAQPDAGAPAAITATAAVRSVTVRIAAADAPAFLAAHAAKASARSGGG